MVIHQAIGMTNPVASSDYFTQDCKESFAVLVVFIDTFLTVSPDRDVVQGTWKFDSEGACHQKYIANYAETTILDLTPFRGRVI
jgi:hypothetical protein